MLKESRGLLNFFTSKKVLFLGFFLILCFILFSYSSGKSNRVIDGYSTGYSDFSQSAPKQPDTIQSQPLPKPVVQEKPSFVETKNSAPSNVGNYVANNTVSPNDLLPLDKNTQFSDFNMLNSGSMAMPDLLEPGYLIGIDTIGQTLRNANLQERSDPYIPKSNVGPWNNSTIEPDLARVPLEIGASQ